MKQECHDCDNLIARAIAKGKESLWRHRENDQSTMCPIYLKTSSSRLDQNLRTLTSRRYDGEGSPRGTCIKLITAHKQPCVSCSEPSATARKVLVGLDWTGTTNNRLDFGA